MSNITPRQKLIDENVILLASYFDNLKIINEKIDRNMARKNVMANHTDSSSFSKDYEQEINELKSNVQDLKNEFLYIIIDRFIDYKFKNSDRSIYDELLKRNVDIKDITSRESNYLEKANNKRIMKAGSKKTTYIIPLNYKPDYIISKDGSFVEFPKDELPVVVKPEIDAYNPAGLLPKIYTDRNITSQRTDYNKNQPFDRSLFGTKK